MKWLLSRSPRLVIVAVLGCFASGIFLLLMAAFSLVRLIYASAAGGDIAPKAVKLVLVQFIGLIDVFLVAPAFFLVGLGLYQLCFGPMDLPAWLNVRSLDDLKNKIIKIVVVVLAVLFLGEAVEWGRGVEILYYGGAIALVIAALSLFLSSGRPRNRPQEPPPRD